VREAAEWAFYAPNAEDVLRVEVTAAMMRSLGEMGGDLRLDPKAAYLYYASNETIQGVQFASEPEAGDVPLVCDASSDFLSRPVDIRRYDLYYACAQK